MKTLNLESNEISWVSSQTFAGPRYLSYLNLGKNQLTQLDSRLFERQIRLQQLLLYDNSLTANSFSVWKEQKLLTVVDVTNNKISEIPRDALDSYKDSLVEFSAGGNLLTSSAFREIKKLTMVTKLVLDDIWRMNSEADFNVDFKNAIKHEKKSWYWQSYDNSKSKCCLNAVIGRKGLILAIFVLICYLNGAKNLLIALIMLQILMQILTSKLTGLSSRPNPIPWQTDNTLL